MDAKDLLEIFKKEGLTYFTGIPDFTFKKFINLLYNAKDITHRPAVNECEAIFFAGAYHISTGNIGVVYMQNSRLGKAVNPLVSYSGPYVYRIPMLLLIGWRGGITDEPQYKQAGGITLKLLEILQIKYKLMPDTLEESEELIKQANDYMKKTGKAYAIIIPKENKIEGEEITERNMASFLSGKKLDSIHRRDVIKSVLEIMNPLDVLVATTGNTSKEVFELREERNEGHEKDFLNIGGMGGALPQGVEIALQHPDRKVYVLDGDGALLMQLGSIISAGYYNPPNLIHIIIDNQSYQSEGNQPSISRTTHFPGIGIISGFLNGHSAYFLKDFKEKLNESRDKKGPHIFVAYCDKKCDKNLGPPTINPINNKKAFMNNLK